jgi:hypothetical protein
MADTFWDINNYKPPADGSVFYGKEQHFNEDVVFYKGVRIHGNLEFDYTKYVKLVVTQLESIGPGQNLFEGPVTFNSDITINATINTDDLLVKNTFQLAEYDPEIEDSLPVIFASKFTRRVGINTVEAAGQFQVGVEEKSFTILNSGTVGVGSAAPGIWINDSEDPSYAVSQRLKLDVLGSIRIKNTIFDSADVPGKNGYFFARDQRGVRWLQQLANDDGVMPLSVVLWGGNGNFPPPGYELCDGANGKPNLAPITDLNGNTFQYIIKVV